MRKTVLQGIEAVQEKYMIIISDLVLMLLVIIVFICAYIINDNIVLIPWTLALEHTNVFALHIQESDQ